MKEKKHGGARSGAGRKPVTDKKGNVTIHPLQSRINRLGYTLINEISVKSIEKEYKKINKNT